MWSLFIQTVVFVSLEWFELVYGWRFLYLMECVCINNQEGIASILNSWVWMLVVMWSLMSLGFIEGVSLKSTINRDSVRWVRQGLEVSVGLVVLSDVANIIKRKVCLLCGYSLSIFYSDALKESKALVLFAQIESGLLLTALSLPSWSWDLGDSPRGSRWEEKRAGELRVVVLLCYSRWIPSECHVTQWGWRPLTHRFFMLWESPSINEMHSRVLQCVRRTLSSVNSSQGSEPKEASSRRNCDNLLSPQSLSTPSYS